MARRPLLALFLVLPSAACGIGVGDLTEALSPSVAAPPSADASPSVDGPTGTGRPAIVVRTPRPGDEIVSPVTIAGTADVFEATVSIAILDAAGQTLAAGFATATCGSGCRVRYSGSLSFFTELRQAGTIEVFETSAEDGSALHLVSVPVTLVPGS